MSSFKKADGIIDSIQKQATGSRTLDGSAIEDFLSIAGYEDPAGGGGGGDFSTANVTFTNTFEGQSVEFSHANASETITIDGKEYSGLIDMLTENTVLLVGNTPTKVMASGSEYGGGWPTIESITATGSITVDTDPDLNVPIAVVSGDGTITMNWVNSD